MDTIAHDKTQPVLLLIGILFVLTVGVSFLPGSWLGAKPQVARYAPIDLRDLSSSFAGSDANSDGTLSWAEFVTKSLDLSPHQTQSAVESDPEALAILNDENNLTSSFSKNLYITSAMLQQKNITDGLSEQEAITQLIAKEAEKVVGTSYSAQDVRLAKSETLASRKAYGNAMADTLKGLITEGTMTVELTSIVSFLEKGDEGELLPIKNRVAVLDRMIARMLAMEVPPSAASVHLLALNRTAAFRGTLEGLTRAYNDPIRATFSIQSYQDDVIAVGRIYAEYGTYFKAQRVPFGTTEAGYVFVSGYDFK
jgi:hypothetical protein